MAIVRDQLRPRVPPMGGLPSGVPWHPESLMSGDAPFSPLSLGPLLLNWWDVDLSRADATIWQESTRSTVAGAVNDPCGSLFDRSGNGAYQVQATDTKRPLLKQVMNGGRTFYVLEGDGTDDTLKATIGTGAVKTLFLVAKKLSAPAVGVQNPASFGTAAQILTRASDGSDWNYFGSTGPTMESLGGDPTTWTIIELVYASTSSCTPVINGVAGSAFNPDDAYSTSVALSLLAALDGTQAGDFQFAAALILSGESAAQRTQVRQYLAGLKGITL